MAEPYSEMSMRRSSDSDCAMLVRRGLAIDDMGASEMRIAPFILIKIVREREKRAANRDFITPMFAMERSSKLSADTPDLAR